MNIKGMDKAAVLFALWTNSREQGLSWMGREAITLERCQDAIADGHMYFDYFGGRIMKVDLSGEEVNTWGYNRDNGEGAAERVIASMKGGASDA